MSIPAEIINKLVSFAADAAGIAIRRGTTEELEDQGITSVENLLRGLGLYPPLIAEAFGNDPFLAATGVFAGAVAVLAFGPEAAAALGVGALTGVAAIAAEATINLLLASAVEVAVSLVGSLFSQEQQAGGLDIPPVEFFGSNFNLFPQSFQPGENLVSASTDSNTGIITTTITNLRSGLPGVVPGQIDVYLPGRQLLTFQARSYSQLVNVGDFGAAQFTAFLVDLQGRSIGSLVLNTQTNEMKFLGKDGTLIKFGSLPLGAAQEQVLVSTEPDGSCNIALLNSADGNTQHVSIHTDSSNNLVISGDVPGLTINLGTANDSFFGAGPGSIVNGGSGQDTFKLTNDVLIVGAKPTDKIVIGEQVLHGGIRVKGSESPWSVGLGGIKYAIDTAGELVIQDVVGDRTFVGNFQGGPGTPVGEDVAGIFLGEASSRGYLLVDPNLPSDWQQDQFEFVNGLYKALYGIQFYQGDDPLVLDLTGSGINLTDRSSVGPLFDMNGNGFAVPTGWTEPNVGFLVDDKNGNGQIDNIGEMFGGEGKSGFAALAVDDANGDGVIDANDPVFAQLQVWVDANANGKVDPGELESLAQAGVAAINLTATPQTHDMVGGNQVLETGSYVGTGRRDRAGGGVPRQRCRELCHRQRSAGGWRLHRVLTVVVRAPA